MLFKVIIDNVHNVTMALPDAVLVSPLDWNLIVDGKKLLSQNWRIFQFIFCTLFENIPTYDVSILFYMLSLFLLILQWELRHFGLKLCLRS